MPRFAANLSMMYTEHAFLDRFAAAARDGFRAVEFLFPYEHPAATITKALHDNGLQQVLFNAPPGDFAAGERGISSLAGREEEFRSGFARALDYAAALGCPRIHVMAWSENVWTSATSALENGRTWLRSKAIAPIDSPFSSIGTASTVRKPFFACSSRTSGNSVSMSGTTSSK